MTRISPFDSPLLLGFDRFERMLDRVAKASSDGYPPYNIEQIDDNRFRITLAVAGFREADLAVSVAENQLSIRGKQEEEGGRVFIHRGIAARQFLRTFVMAEGMEVTGAELDNGLLHVDVVRLPPASTVRTVEIRKRRSPVTIGETVEPDVAASGERPQAD